MGLFDFMANADPGTPGSYQDMLMRQKIAYAMLANDRKGYPKNVGEGLTAIGDALAQRSMMNRMEQATAAFNKAQQEKVGPPPDSATSATAPPTQTSEVSPDLARAPVVALDDENKPEVAQTAENVETQPAVTGTGTVGPSGAEVAAAQSGLLPPRDRVAATIAAQGGPQVNPTQPPAGGPASPATQPPAGGQLPDQRLALADTGTISDIPVAPRLAPGVQLAQARPATTPVPVPPAPVGPGDPGRLRVTPEQDPGIYNRPPPIPTAPMMPGKSRQQVMDEYHRDQAAAQGDVYSENLFKGRIERQEQARKEAYDQNLKTWEAKKQLIEQQTLQWEQAQRALPQTNAATAEAQAKAASAADVADVSRRTGMSPEVFFPRMDADKNRAVTDMNVLEQAKLARQALNAGIISGGGATMRIDYERAKAFFGNIPAAELVARTEQYQAALKNTIKNALNNIQPGDPRTTNSDMLVAEGMTGGDIRLQTATQKKLVDQTLDAVNRRTNDYEEYLHSKLRGSKLYEYYEVKQKPLHEKPETANAYISKLMEGVGTPNEQLYKQQFDNRFGTGAAQLEINRARRRREAGG